MSEHIASEATVFKVPDISCDHCVNSITTEVTKVDDVRGVVVDLEAKTVTVDGGDRAAVIAAIDEAGFDTVE